MISQSTIDRIIELPVHEVISHYVSDLKKAGTSWKAKSPFSNEKSASFFVVPHKNIFKDFSSGHGGSAINFVMLYTGKTFPDAVKEIGELCKVSIEYDEAPTEEDTNLLLEKELLFKINEAAARKYQGELVNTNGDHPAFKEVINKRAYNADTILQWGIGYAPGESDGYAPNQWRFMVELVGDKNRKGAMDLGLIKEKKGHTYDFFRHRVMYPIHNHAGRIVGFGGRTLYKPDDINAKWLNSSESKIYIKDQVLYGLHFAHKAIHDTGYAYLMEGYNDVISFHQAGYNNTVCTCGTALTDSQAKILKRYTDKVVLMRDGDKGGIDATIRDIKILARMGIVTAVVPMPDYGNDQKIDPDEMTRILKVK